MEFKVRKESQTLMEKTFNRYSNKRGNVSTDKLTDMIKQMNPDIVMDKDELSNMLTITDKNGTGEVDLDGFNKIAVHFLMKQAKHDHDQFIHKHEIGSADFGM